MLLLSKFMFYASVMDVDVNFCMNVVSRVVLNQWAMYVFQSIAST